MDTFIFFYYSMAVSSVLLIRSIATVYGGVKGKKNPTNNIINANFHITGTVRPMPKKTEVLAHWVLNKYQVYQYNIRPFA